jgi:hypothetical protein
LTIIVATTPETGQGSSGISVKIFDLLFVYEISAIVDSRWKEKGF